MAAIGEGGGKRERRGEGKKLAYPYQVDVKIPA